MNILDPRLWLALLLSHVLLFGAGYWRGDLAGAKAVQAKWDAAKIIQMAAAEKAEAANRATENRLKTQVIEAQNEAQDRIKKLEVDRAAARAQSASLHDTIAALRGQLSAATADAARQYADTASAVLDDCQAKYAELAATADRLASERQTLIDAWPR